MRKVYPRIAIDPAHCGIYKEYHDRNGERHILDGPYVVRRKVVTQQDRSFILLQGERIPVVKIADCDEMNFVCWETTDARRG